MLALAGGVTIGLAAVALMAFNGRIAGISGIIDGFVFGEDRRWRGMFLGGLLLGGLLVFLVAPDRIPGVEADGFSDYARLIIGGLLVGFGTRMGSGCTSGHGVCGIGRLATRSLVATCVFMAAMACGVFAFYHLLGLEVL